MKNKFIMITVILLAPLATVLANPSFCQNSFESTPTLSAGRVKPFYVHATETFRYLTGQKTHNHLSAVEAYCKLALQSLGHGEHLKLYTEVNHLEAKEFLGLDRSASHYPIESLVDRSSELRMEILSINQNTPYRQELNRLYRTQNIYKSLIAGETWTIASLVADEVHFMPIADFFEGHESLNAQEFQAAIWNSKESYIQMMGDRYLTELKYVKWDLYSWAILISILGIILLITLPTKWPGIVFALSSLGIQVLAIGMRVVISERGPVTNMFETVVFGGCGALAIALIIYSYRRDISFIVAGLAITVLSLMMAKFANNMLDPTISPLMPILRDNFWLSTHVTITMLSYSALSISWILSNALLIRSKFSYVSPQTYNHQVDLIYSAIKYGVVLLTIGVFLGAVWADYSWGRFWAWDPKETWSLISILVYTAILHGRYTSMITARRFVPLTAAAFLSIMMTWFGVNYILATGLHSYGFSEGGAIFLGSFFLIQFAVLALVFVKDRPAPKLQEQS